MPPDRPLRPMTRFLLVTLAITGMYVGLQQARLSLSPLAAMGEGTLPRARPLARRVSPESDQ